MVHLATNSVLNLRIQNDSVHNVVVNVTEAAFFGLGLGFASSVAVLPLFIYSLGGSSALIGLVSSIQLIGWQLPQAFTAGHVAKQRHFKSLAVRLLFQERWPFLALAVVAWLSLGSTIALALTFLLLAWQALGGGIGASAWQNMIVKIMPERRRGTFWGIQAATATLTASGGAVIAGRVLQNIPQPTNFAICFFIAGSAMMIGWFIMKLTREQASDPPHLTDDNRPHWHQFADILKQDGQFRAFLVLRGLSQLSWMSVGFYTIFAVRTYHADEATVGLMSGIFLLAQALGHPAAGWLGDHFGHRRMFAVNTAIAGITSALVLSFPGPNALYIIFALLGFANSTLWTNGMPMYFEFGKPAEKPYYVGLANTLAAPAVFLAPVIGGWLVDNAGYSTMFTVAAVMGLLTAAGLLFVILRKAAPSKAETGESSQPNPALVQ
jgi:MFS family permease